MAEGRNTVNVTREQVELMFQMQLTAASTVVAVLACCLSLSAGPMSDLLAGQDSKLPDARLSCEKKISPNTIIAKGTTVN